MMRKIVQVYNVIISKNKEERWELCSVYSRFSLLFLWFSNVIHQSKCRRLLETLSLSLQSFVLKRDRVIKNRVATKSIRCIYWRAQFHILFTLVPTPLKNTTLSIRLPFPCFGAQRTWRYERGCEKYKEILSTRMIPSVWSFQFIFKRKNKIFWEKQLLTKVG